MKIENGNVTYTISVVNTHQICTPNIYHSHSINMKFHPNFILCKLHINSSICVYTTTHHLPYPSTETYYAYHPLHVSVSIFTKSAALQYCYICMDANCQLQKLCTWCPIRPLITQSHPKWYDHLWPCHYQIIRMVVHGCKASLTNGPGSLTWLYCTTGFGPWSCSKLTSGRQDT